MYDCVWLGAYRVTAYVCVRAVHNLCAASVCTNDVCVGVQLTSACVLVRELRELLLQKKAKEEAEQVPVVPLGLGRTRRKRASHGSIAAERAHRK